MRTSWCARRTLPITTCSNENGPKGPFFSSGWGEGPLDFAEACTAVERDLPGIQMKTYFGVGHVPMEEIPQQSAADAMRFLLG
ncbi:hypothetical protein Pres01_56710 [Metapseudomonas resinovorans]|nr:hypothetical protein Pres01_56710 [Pseudomonas resinovorans]